MSLMKSKLLVVDISYWWGRPETTAATGWWGSRVCGWY